MKNQRKTIVVLTLVLIISLATLSLSVEAKPSTLPKGLQKRIPKNGFIVKEEFGDVIRYREYIPLDPSIAQSFPVDPSLLEDLPDHIFYSVNVYAYETDDSVIVIDAGHELLAKKLYACLKSDFGKKPITVLLTHGHADHAGGGSYLQKKGATIWVHPGDYTTVLNGYESPYVPDDFKFTGYSAETYPMEYFPIPFEGLMILYTPGHTQGSVSLYRQEIGSLFTGDLTVTLREHESPSDFTTEVIYGALLSHAAYPQLLEAQAYSLLTLPEIVPEVDTIYPGHFGPYSGIDMQTVIGTTLGAINAILYPVP